jgi:hypothetical protein
VKVLTNATVNERAVLAAGTQFYHPTSLEKVTRAAATEEFMLAGRSLDEKFVGVWVNTKRIRGASGLTLLLAKASDVPSSDNE